MSGLPSMHLGWPWGPPHCILEPFCLQFKGWTDYSRADLPSTGWNCSVGPFPLKVFLFLFTCVCVCAYFLCLHRPDKSNHLRGLSPSPHQFIRVQFSSYSRGQLGAVRPIVWDRKRMLFRAMPSVCFQSL